MAGLPDQVAACRICRGPILPQLDLGLQPVCNRFLAGPQEPEYKHVFQTGVCQHCGIMQLLDPFPAAELQPKVEWITYTEPEGHLDDLADQLASRLPTTAFILGVSFKDDSTLERLQKKGFRTQRLELAVDLDIFNPGAGVETIQGQLTVARAKMLSKKYGRADALIVRHILEHAYDIPQFLQAIKELLTPGGYAVFEVPDCSKQLELLDYSALWEEHLVYFTPGTYQNCFVQHGFTIERLDIVPALMESSIVAVVRAAEIEGMVEKTVAPPDQTLSTEEIKNEVKRVQTFTNSFPLQKKILQSYFRQHRAAVFGAGHFSCLLINALALPVQYIIDDNPHKKGLYLPGSHLPIYGSEVLVDGSKKYTSPEAPPKICVLAINPSREQDLVQRFKTTTFRSFCPVSPYTLFTEVTALKEHSPEVYYGVGNVLALDRETINQVKRQSFLNARQRSRLCTHQTTMDPLQEMMIVHPQGTYVRPHKHQGKPESLHVLEGEALVIIFDEQGNITQTIPVGDYASGKKFYYKLDGPLYHTLYITSEVFIFHETTTGPFRRFDTIFAPWSPEETDSIGVKKFMNNLKKDFLIRQPLPQPHALVLGGTKGIGRSIAKTLAERGYRVSVLGRSKPSRALEQIDDWQADLTYPGAGINVINQLIAKNGPITHLICSQRYRGEDDWDKEMTVDVTATAKIIEHLKDQFNRTSLPAIVVISSIAGTTIAYEQNAQYHVAKAALNQLVKYYAATLGPQGIRVNSISPGTTVKEESQEFYSQNKELRELYDTITPLQRMGTAEDVARVVAFLCSDEAAYITGQNIIVEGGASLQGPESIARRLLPPKKAKASVAGSDNLAAIPNNQAFPYCRLCRREAKHFIMRLACTPIGDAYLYEKKELPRYPLDLYLCGECGLLQIPHLIDPGLIYRDYIYHTADSLGLVEHFRKYVASILARINLPVNSFVVEVGSNDGSALACFKKAGMRVLGIDPAREIAEKATANDLTTLPEFFSSSLARRLAAEQGKASLIMANNVLANIDDLTDVIAGIKVLLAPEGVLVFETGYALDLIQKRIFDNIYHEHLSYFSVKPLQQFFRRQGLQLIHVERAITKGGSIRCTVQSATGTRHEDSSVAELMALENVAGIHAVNTLQQFALSIEELKKQLTALLKNFKAQGKRIAGYGAAVGCTTVLYALGLEEFIEFLLDDNTNRQNRYAPGLPIPVRSPGDIYHADYTLILAWQYAEPIMKKHPQYLEQGGKFIQFLPTLTVIGK